MLSVTSKPIKLSVVVLSVMAPLNYTKKFYNIGHKCQVIVLFQHNSCQYQHITLRCLLRLR
jgi:hypothetical protein